jgi:hypothetical protein
LKTVTWSDIDGGSQEGDEQREEAAAMMLGIHLLGCKLLMAKGFVCENHLPQPVTRQATVNHRFRGNKTKA